MYANHQYLQIHFFCIVLDFLKINPIENFISFNECCLEFFYLDDVLQYHQCLAQTGVIEIGEAYMTTHFLKQSQTNVEYFLLAVLPHASSFSTRCRVGGGKIGLLLWWSILHCFKNFYFTDRRAC